MAAEHEFSGSKRVFQEGGLHLGTRAPVMEALQDDTAGVDLMERHGLKRYDSERTRTLLKGFAHFLSPRLQALVREKPRIMLNEKADFAEMLSEAPSGRPIQELSMDLLRRSFRIRRKVVMAGTEEDDAGDGVPPDIPLEEQTTNKFSPAYTKKVASAKRARPSDDEGAAASSQSTTVSVKSAVKPLITKLMRMQWPGWKNPFSIVLTKNKAPPNYFESIERPMNLTYIRDNVNKNKYSTVAEVEADLELIVRNAQTFNRPHDPVYSFAKDLQTAFRNDLPAIRNMLEGAMESEAGDDAQVDKRARIG